MDLRDKVCIVTGGGSGIGWSTALKMAEEGAKVAVVGRTLSKVESVQKEIEVLGGTAVSFSLDVADHQAAKIMVKSVLNSFGRSDILVNAAGHSSFHRKLLTTTPDEIHRVIDSNLVGTIFCTQAVIPAMLENEEGTIINVTSIAGTKPGLMGGMIYSAAKAAVINFAEFINTEFKNRGIRASAVILGEIDTPMLENRPVPPSKEARDTMVPPDEVAKVMVLIAQLSNKTAIPELVLRPAFQRDRSKEVGVA